MKRLALIICLTAGILLVAGCKNHSAGTRAGIGHADSTTIKYAQGFTLTYLGDIRLIDLQDPQREESQSFHYALVPLQGTTQEVPEGYTPVPVPISKVICMTSLQLSSFIKLGELDAVVGITSTRHLFNEEMNRRLEDGRTLRLGNTHNRRP